eukprot:CAMPEP_0117037610 /NCGR_PEP_ID=MMETSP0472-20121206/26524_1 /TAXON_ID=693140 ORGANISM="Tiarina fusus, Strain LIS" /NCGR_SAMPLE_ID=MMETSP0472 /ASSEMBLY_ACC=CAM_ASM_000603 /LENGTH=320 /DNA_ID=CAMNT_0004747619 /DNA_START=149 /DNA_END=1111 /DNA_ORIENTATION=+
MKIQTQAMVGMALAWASQTAAFSVHPRYQLSSGSIATRSSSKLASTAEQNDVKTSTSPAPAATSLSDAKEAVVDLLTSADENSEVLEPFLEVMKASYLNAGTDSRHSQSPPYNGDWYNLNHPAFPGRLGLNEENGRPSYKIGTLTFGLIPSARDIVVEVEKMVQHVHYLEISKQDFPSNEQIPEQFRETVLTHPEHLRSSNIDTHFEIPGTGVKGILRMEAFVYPHSENPNGFDSWNVGGRCFAKPGVDSGAWEAVFGGSPESKTEDMVAKGTADEPTDVEERLRYTLPSPMSAYQTVVYLDDHLRVTVGHRGSVMIVQR